MNSSQTSYVALFERSFADGLRIERIEIPMLQRDYAQGRKDTRTRRIRQTFLDALLMAARGGKPLSLDFVYGDIRGGVLLPLDGQQRLTTLFLLHWYVAVRSGQLQASQGWLRLGYATRASARMFCEHLARITPDLTEDKPSTWISDQPWFLAGWSEDPTIQSMLVVLDDLHHQLANDDPMSLWTRLVDDSAPPITFHLLPLDGMGLADDIYIRMNSRGKPLTEFELFKARFERLLERRSPEAAQKFAHRIDDAWIDAFWRPSAVDGAMDASLLRYIRFLTDLCVWRRGLESGARQEQLEARAQRVYVNDERWQEHIELLMNGFDTWVGQDPSSWFGSWFVSQHADGGPGAGAGRPAPLRLFRARDRSDCNLFSACCQHYEPGARSPGFGWPELLLLYACLIQRWHGVGDAARRLRVVRNLIEGSQDELRAERMPTLLVDVDSIMREGSVATVRGFNQRIAVEEERNKRAFLDQHPALEGAVYRLEDHPLLRGTLVAFELDATSLARHGIAFEELFAEDRTLCVISAALLAAGDYGTRIRGRFFDFGSSRNLAPWRTVLTSMSRADGAPLRKALACLLDLVAGRGEMPLDDVLARFADEFLKECERNQCLDWRYYFVKYDAMRGGASGRYAGRDGRLGYSVCMLEKYQMNSNYRDPYLHAARLASDFKSQIFDPDFTGYEGVARWMPLRRTGVAFRAVDEGFLVRIPDTMDESERQSVEAVLARRGATQRGDVWVLEVPQLPGSNGPIDREDRIARAAEVMRHLVEAGH